MASERHWEQPLANHTFCGELGNRPLAFDGRCHYPRLRQRSAQVLPCIPQLIARFSRGGTSGRVGKRTVADPSRKPPSDRDGANVSAAGVRAEYMSDDSFDPLERLRGPEYINWDVVEEAFEVVDGPIVGLICETGCIVVDEHNIVRAFAAIGHERLANSSRRQTPIRDGQDGTRIRVHRFPSNPVGRDGWQQPVPSPDQGQAVLEHVGADDRFQQPPRVALVDPDDRIGKRARQQGKQQFVAYLPIPTNAHVAITRGVVVLLGDAGNGPAVLRRPEVAVHDDLPSR